MDQNKNINNDAQSLMHDFSTPSSKNQVTNNTNLNNNNLKSDQKFMKKVFFGLLGVLVVFLGIGSGYVLSNRFGEGADGAKISSKSEATVTETEAEASNFNEEESDLAEGVLNIGSIEGEGTHYLDRGAGEQKYVYLTSTVINLKNYVGKKVQVWGNTLAATNAPWLMDVQKIKVIE